MPTTSNKGQEVKEGYANHEGGQVRIVQLHCSIPKTGACFDLTSAGIVFRFEDGTGVNVLTEELENFLRSLNGNKNNPVSQKEYKYSLYAPAPPCWPKNDSKKS